ncbi:hypothetical protein PHYBOEH_010385 [Phytophthora boehmeriae]|uniref:Ubiquitinyl hydrolase 1 n=1 Tax=Phytophthora boehmeriae TaxID=109152 RepID=A0A8T1VRA6_9STRA|nr:hypothetical protein PHYBOEH_010385 [Phytophthora boehmeriae]
MATKGAALRRFAASLERQLAEDRLVEGADWFLISSQWWTRVFGGSGDASSDENAGQTDDDSDGTDDSLPRGNVSFRVENESLVDLELSSRKREVVVLKSMLVEGQDYRLVSQRVWNQLTDQFGFDWEISRPVVARGPSRKLIVEVNPVTFELLVWRTGLEEPVEPLDAEKKPLVLVASETCALKVLQEKIWQIAAMEPQLRKMFPNVTADNISTAVQVCYRMNESSSWVPLRDAVVTEDRGLNGFRSARRPDILVESTRVGELQLEPRDYKPGREKLHHLLVEGRFAANPGEEVLDWRHGKFFSDIHANAWRFQLEVNQLIDALDTDKKWYESRVVAINDTAVKVHYRGWTAKWDEWLPRLSLRILPLHTKVPNWRDFQVGDEVLVGRAVAGKNYPEWRNAHVTCSNPDCGNESITFDPFMSLSVPIPSNESVTVETQLFWANGNIPMKYQRGYDETSAKRIELHDSMKNLNISPKTGPITLLNCVSKFTEREQLGQTDTWYCPKCKDHVRAFKKFDLFSLPNVLIFHLKRFRYAQNSFYLHRDKISTLVDFPIEGLDLSEFVTGPHNDSMTYDLYAVSEHIGGLGGGHYTAVAKNPLNQRWFSFNDSHTSETSADSAVSSRAYVLFYKRRDEA